MGSAIGEYFGLDGICERRVTICQQNGGTWGLTYTPPPPPPPPPVLDTPLALEMPQLMSIYKLIEGTNTGPSSHPSWSIM